MRRFNSRFVPLFLVLLMADGNTLSQDVQQVGKLSEQIQTLYKEGKYDEAIPIAKQALEIREKALGPEHPSTATSLNSLAVLYVSMGAYAKAEPLYQRALKIKEKALGPEHPGTALSLNN